MQIESSDARLQEFKGVPQLKTSPPCRQTQRGPSEAARSHQTFRVTFATILFFQTDCSTPSW